MFINFLVGGLNLFLFKLLPKLFVLLLKLVYSGLRMKVVVTNLHKLFYEFYFALSKKIFKLMINIYLNSYDSNKLFYIACRNI